MAIDLRKVKPTPEQSRSIEYDGGDLLIKGVPGAGKSVVLMRRAIRYNEKAIQENKRKKILILAYTNSLVKYTAEAVAELSPSPCMIEVSTIHSLCRSIYMAMTKKRYLYIIGKGKDRVEFADKAIQKHLTKTQKKHRFHDVDAEFWADEFQWIKQKNITSLAQYVLAERVGRGGKVRITREERAIVYEMFQEYCALLKAANKLEWEDIFAYILENKDKLPASALYDYVLVDEAQDLSYVTLKVAKTLTLRAITIAADKAQKIYSTSFSWKELGIDIRGQASKSLSKTFRSTKQIAALAESLLEVNRALQTDESEYTEPVSPDREGDIPQIICCKSGETEKRVVMDLIKSRLSGHDTVIGLFYRSWAEYMTIRGWLLGEGILFEDVKKKEDYSVSTPGVKLMTLHSSKGLEFDTVIIPKFNASCFPLNKLLEDADEEQVAEIKMQERSLVYVGMTRAMYDLYITYSGTPSSYLAEFDPELYKYVSCSGTLLPKPKRMFLFPKDLGREKAATPKPTIFDKKPAGPLKVQDFSKVTTSVAGDPNLHHFIIKPHQYPAHSAFLGKRVGDEVVIAKVTHVIESIELPTTAKGQVSVTGKTSDGVLIKETVKTKTSAENCAGFSKNASHFKFDNILSVSRKKPFGIVIEGETVKAAHWTVLVDEVVPYVIKRYSVDVGALCRCGYGLDVPKSDVRDAYVLPYFLRGDMSHQNVHYRYMKSYDLSVYVGGSVAVVDMLDSLLCDYLKIDKRDVELYYHNK